MTDVFLSPEAQRKMLARGVEFKEVEFAATFPDVTWTNRSRTGKLYEIRQRGDIAVVVAKRGFGLQVMSILWRHSEQWTDGEMFITRMVYDEGRKIEKPRSA